MLDLAVEADDESLLEDVQSELSTAEEELAKLEFRRMFSNQWIESLLCRDSGGFRWYRSTRLGFNAITYVYALD